jgi:predicted NBD/HSP70 family sugar kinase
MNKSKTKANTKPLWGIDMGGTKLEGVILSSPDSTDVLFRNRIDTEADLGYEHVIEQMNKLVGLMKKETGLTPEKIGIGTPGVYDHRIGAMKNCNSVVLNGKPLKSDLEKSLGVELRLANDANCFALAETKLGVVSEQYPDAEVVFGVIMGSGVGGGIVVNQKIINGLQGIAGEWGHNFLDESGGPCYCGKVGCVETIISGPSLERYYFNHTGNRKHLKDIASLAESKVDPTAQKAMQRLVHFFGLGLSAVINILDPDVIVIGGGVGNIDLLYDRGLDAVSEYVFNNRFETPIVQPSLGDSAGVFGAAHLVSD